MSSDKKVDILIWNILGEVKLETFVETEFMVKQKEISKIFFKKGT